ncbi:chromate transporter [Ruminococcus sp.]|uniref:chromate transporter n=1 Tax=Ruminococcus sp. TaxID=41978 RepID=UPI0028735301|nr:chromate transporter [Ruminococcus sp.]
MKKKIKLYLSLFLTFMKIGVVTFGGGYAMIPIIEHEISEKKGWICGDDLLEVVAISETTPGPIAICAATFIGYRLAGVFGAFCATFGVVLPSFIIIYLISLFLRAFEQMQVIKYAFFGIRAGVLALLVKAVVSMFKKCPKNIIAYIIMAASFAAVAFFSCNVIIVIVGAAVIGLAASLIAGKAGKKL